MWLRTVVGLFAALISGCTRPEPTAPPPAAAAATTPAAEVSPVFEPPAATEARQTPQEEADGEGHAHEAPHGGTLIELGEEFAHLELLLDAATGRLTVYALDGEAEQSVRLAQPSIAMSLAVPDVPSPIDVTLAPVESALTGEKAGDTSQFSAVVPGLQGRTAFRGTVASLAIRGQSFSRVEFAFPAAGH